MIIDQIAILPLTILLAIVASQYFILLNPRKKYTKDYSPSLSILVPAHNEEKYIEQTVSSILGSDYRGKKEVIVINDGSKDRTGEILRKFSGKIRVLKTNHIGKARALNKAISLAKNNVIIVVDGDTEMEKDSIRNLVRPLQDKKVAAVGGIVKIKNHRKPLSWWQKIEYLYASFFHSLCDRINGNMFTPGPLSAFKKSLVKPLEGFNTKVFLEDVDMSLRLVKKGYKVRIADDAIVRTNVPETLKPWASQRKRWMKGGIELVKNHKSMFFRKKFGTTGFYPFPILSYWYFHAIIMGIVLFAQIFGGYYQYFYLNGDFISLNVAQYFFYWFSILGIVNLTNMMLTGMIPVTIVGVLSILITVLAYPLYLYPFIKFREKFTAKDAIALFFMFPYWLMLLVLQLVTNIRWIIPTEKNNWWVK